jgi:hypothetical protein
MNERPKIRDAVGPGWPGSQPRRREQSLSLRQNVGRTERIASLVAGLLLGTIGIRKSGRLGFALSVAAGEMIYRGVTGHCHVYAALGIEPDQPVARTRSVARRPRTSAPSGDLARRSPESAPSSTIL